MDRIKNRLGFTLLELLIAVTVFAIIAVSIYSSLGAGIRVWKRSSEAMSENQVLRLFFEMVSSDLKNAVRYYAVPGSDQKNFEAEPGKISFMALVAAASKESKAHAELARVVYYLDREKMAVCRKLATIRVGFDPEKAKAVELVTDVEEKDFSFEYCYPADESRTSFDWKDGWEDDKNIPGGVRIKLRDFVKYVYIPAGKMDNRNENPS